MFIGWKTHIRILMLGFQFSPKVPIDSVQSQSKSQQTFFFIEIDKFNSKIYREVQSS